MTLPAARAFIPDLKDRDECYADLEIYSCAGKEAKQIPQEYIEYYGEDDSIRIYNELIGMIGEREKKCLPFVNMCLRAWMEMLSNDLDLWADLSPLDYDKWLAEEIVKAKNTPTVEEQAMS